MMTRVVPGLRTMLVAGMVLGLGGIAGCGADSTGSSASNTAGSSSGVIDGPGDTGSQTAPSTPADGGNSSQSDTLAVSKANTVTLSWQPPTENSDGSTLSDLKGYKVHYGSASKTYTETIKVTNPGLTTYVVQNMPSGTYYFAVTSYNSAGAESSLSSEIGTLVVD